MSDNTYLGKRIYYQSGYAVIRLYGKVRPVHVLEWEQVNGPKPEGMFLHHIDKDRSNWNINNLQLLSRSDHQRIHEGWIREDGVWTKKLCKKCNRTLPLRKFWIKKGNKPHWHCIKCSTKTVVRHIIPNKYGNYECSNCKQWKSKNSFYINNKNGKPRSYCKKCCAILTKNRRWEKMEIEK